jgi:hypothetical protein
MAILRIGQCDDEIADLKAQLRQVRRDRSDYVAQAEDGGDR